MFKLIIKVFTLLVVIRTVVVQRIAKDMCQEYIREASRQTTRGNATTDIEFPHMVALGYGSSRSPVWLCGGSLISDQFVITAAHCTSLQNAGSVRVVRLGSRTITPRRGQPYSDISVARVIRHPEYNSPSSYNDIALLKLQRRVRFSRNILPACLNSAINVHLATSTLSALAWDYSEAESDELMKVEFRVVQDRECDRSYRRTSRNKLPNGVDDEVQLCVRGDFPRDVCQDDFEGPLEYKNGKFHYIIGLTSFGTACGISRTPGVYTRISAFVPWIESEVWP